MERLAAEGLDLDLADVDEVERHEVRHLVGVRDRVLDLVHVDGREKDV